MGLFVLVLLLLPTGLIVVSVDVVVVVVVVGRDLVHGPYFVVCTRAHFSLLSFLTSTSGH